MLCHDESIKGEENSYHCNNQRGYLWTELHSTELSYIQAKTIQEVRFCKPPLLSGVHLHFSNIQEEILQYSNFSVTSEALTDTKREVSFQCK